MGQEKKSRVWERATPDGVEGKKNKTGEPEQKNAVMAEKKYKERKDYEKGINYWGYWTRRILPF